MTFVEAFRAAVENNKFIRRESWNPKATLKAYGPVSEEALFADPSVARGVSLIRFPEAKHWSGDYAPTLGDVEATDWEAFNGNA